MEKEILIVYQSKKSEIKARLEQFKSLPEPEYFNEFLFCLLTPQSNAQRCWSAVQEIKKLPKISYDGIYNILKTRTRFHKTKTQRILKAKEMWKEIAPSLDTENSKEFRNSIAEKVNGYGLKEASHFLRNIGKSNNKIAILDRHILKNLHALNLIPDTKISSKKDYLKKENVFLGYAEKVKIQADELDLFWWSQENGEIFK